MLHNKTGILRVKEALTRPTQTLSQRIWYFIHLRVRVPVSKVCLIKPTKCVDFLRSTGDTLLSRNKNMPVPPRPPLLGGKAISKECVMRPNVSSINGRRARPRCWSAKAPGTTSQATAAEAATAAATRRRRRQRPPPDLLRALRVAALAFLCTGGGRGGGGGGGVHMVSAVCPNRCSGHGECGLENVCECDADWGIVADCSLKECPTGVSWGSKV